MALGGSFSHSGFTLGHASSRQERAPLEAPGMGTMQSGKEEMEGEKEGRVTVFCVPGIGVGAGQQVEGDPISPGGR